MNHLNSTLLMSCAVALAAMPNGASGQMMRQMPPTSHVDMNARELVVSEDHWINSMVDRWTSPQRKSWQALDSSFRGWVSHLVWLRKNIGHLSVISDLSELRFQVPSACPVAIFASPAHSVAESMGHFRDVLPNINWNAWDNIEPKFREIAEWEMSVEHARAQVSKAQKNWWALNGERIQSCLDAAEQGNPRTLSTTISVASTAPAPMPQPNQRYEQIERRAKLDLRSVDHLVAPEPIEQEAREQIGDAAAVDKYIADMDRRKP
jgi:hypothetical protein